MKARWIALMVLVLCGSAAAPARPETDVVGSVKSVEGECHVVRSGAALPVAAGERLYLRDTLVTGNHGKLGAILRDDTVLSLGPGTEIRVEEFVFEPARGQLGMVLNMLRGVASYISGQIAKLAPDSVRFETPLANTWQAEER